jgi:DUF1009 family protein
MAREARERGRRVLAVALEPMAGGDVPGAHETRRFNVGKLGGVISHLKKQGVSEAVMAGKISKTVLYGGGVRPDMRAVALLMRLKDRGDDSIINAVAREFERDGIRLLDMREFCRGLLTPEGPLTRRRPGRGEEADIAFGFRMAKEVGRLGVGQTVVVKEGAVMAVEAIEGTDEAIRRGGLLAKGGAVVVKVSRPGQDMRFDVPAAGLRTIRSMRDAGARVLALEAGMSILMDREEVLREADEAGICVVGVTTPA